MPAAVVWFRRDLRLGDNPALLDGLAPGLARSAVLGLYALASGEPERIDAAVMGAAERAWQRWLEGVCLDMQHGMIGFPDAVPMIAAINTPTSYNTHIGRANMT